MRHSPSSTENPLWTQIRPSEFHGAHLESFSPPLGRMAYPFSTSAVGQPGFGSPYLEKTNF